MRERNACVFVICVCVCTEKKNVCERGFEKERNVRLRETESEREGRESESERYLRPSGKPTSQAAL